MIYNKVLNSPFNVTLLIFNNPIKVNQIKKNEERSQLDHKHDL